MRTRLRARQRAIFRCGPSALAQKSGPGGRAGTATGARVGHFDLL